MAPPKFADLGKSANDLFSKGYNFGFLKFDAKTKASSGLEFKSTASHNTAIQRLFGSMEMKYSLKEHGLTLVERWNTDNTLGTDITVEDRGAKNLKLIFENSMSMNLGKHTGRVKGEYGMDQLFTDVVFDVGTKNAVCSSVFGYENWLLGAQVQTDLGQRKLQKYATALGYKTPTYAMHTYTVDATDFGGSFYHKVDDKIELGATMGWNRNDQSTRFGLGGTYQADRDTQLRAKISSTSQLGLGMTHTLKPGLKLILSTLINLQQFNEGGHKFGFGLEFEQ